MVPLVGWCPNAGSLSATAPAFQVALLRPLPAATASRLMSNVVAPLSTAMDAVRASVTSVARVRMKPGTGKFVVNGKELANYFSELRDQGDAIAPLKLTNLADKFDVSRKLVQVWKQEFRLNLLKALEPPSVEFGINVLGWHKGLFGVGISARCIFDTLKSVNAPVKATLIYGAREQNHLRSKINTFIKFLFYSNVVMSPCIMDI
jgi:hypothetical protein